MRPDKNGPPALPGARHQHHHHGHHHEAEAAALTVPRLADSRRTEANRHRCRAYRETLKAAVLAHYGRACACCGATDRLTVDHVDGNGGEHRLILFGRTDHGGQHFWLWLIKQGYPQGYQILCRPCNASKGQGERCQMDHGAGQEAA
jgi:hypothetical protein